MNNISFKDKLKLQEGWISLLALGVAFMTVIWSIEGAEWTKGTWVLSRAGLVALLLGFVLAKVNFVPGLLAHSFMFSVGMVFVGILVFPFVGPEYEDAEWTKKLGGIVLRAVKWVENGLTGYDPLVFLLSLGLVIWISGYAVSWLVFRRKQVWLAITIMAAILMVNLSYNPPHPFSSFFVFLVSSLLLVVRFNAFLNEERWRRLRMPYKSELWRGAMMVGGALVLLITAVAFAAPSSSQVEPLNQVLSQIQGPWQQIQNGLPGFGSAPNNGSQREGRLRSTYNNFGKSFTIGGPITLSDEPVLRVTGDDPKYLQVTAMDSYDGKGWIATYQDSAPNQKSDKVFNQLSLSAGQSLPTSSDQGRANYRLTVTPLIPNFNAVLTTGDLVSVDRAALLAYHWERIIINSPLSKILPKTVPDGNGGSRTITIDEASNQPIPPDLLPLLKLLNQAQQTGGVSVPPQGFFSVMYDNSGRYSPNSGRSFPQGSLVIKDNTTWEIRNWTFKLPSEADLKALNLQRGGARDQSGRLKIQLSETRQPDKVYTVPASNVYLNTDGVYTFDINTSSLNSAEAVRERFEATDLGQKIKAEVDRLTKEVQGNKVSYDLRNGVPYSLNFDGYQPNYDDLLDATAAQNLNPGETYTTQALRFRADEQSLRNAGQGYPAWVKNRYLVLPEIPQRVKDLAVSLTQGLTNPYDKAKAIEAYLRTIPYSLNAPYTPEGREVVDYFLFDSKLGYCVHFSTAFNVMMRSLGIPTREMTGFNGGEFDSATGTTLVRANAYHAWPQVYFPGYGWVDFEPTPNGPTFDRPKDPAAVPPLPSPTPVAVAAVPVPTVTASVADNANPANEKETPDQGTTNSASANEARQASQAEIFLLWFAVAVGLVLVCFGIYQGNQWWLRTQLSLPDVTPSAVYQRMLKSARRAGLRARPTMTPYEFAAFLGQRLPAVRGEVRSFTDGYVRERYGPQMVDDEIRREMAELEAARARVAQAEAEGREPTTAELWAAFKSQTIFLHSSREIRDMWQSYQLSLIAYRRRNRLDRMTPGFFRSIDRNLDGLRHRIQGLFKAKKPS